MVTDGGVVSVKFWCAQIILWCGVCAIIKCPFCFSTIITQYNKHTELNFYCFHHEMCVPTYMYKHVPDFWIRREEFNFVVVSMLLYLYQQTWPSLYDRTHLQYSYNKNVSCLHLPHALSTLHNINLKFVLSILGQKQNHHFKVNKAPCKTPCSFVHWFCSAQRVL